MSEEFKSIITCDLDGKLETYSEGAEKLFGYTQEEVIGKVRVSGLGRRDSLSPQRRT